MELYIIRHAQSENNAIWAKTKSEVGRFSDPEITDIGHQQAKLVAERLAVKNTAVSSDHPDFQNRYSFDLTHLYTSYMTRSVQTSSYIATATGLPLMGWEEIHEWGGLYDLDIETDSYVSVAGPNRAYFTERFPHLVLPDSFGEQGWWNRPYEERPATVARAKLFYSQLMERHGGTNDRVGMVSHGGFIAIFMLLLTEAFDDDNILKLDKRVWFAQNNTSITRINFGDDYVQVAYQNDVSHLPAELIT